MFAIPITLRYKNQQKFYTNFGALFSALIYVTLIALATAEFLKVLKNEQDNFTTVQTSSS